MEVDTTKTHALCAYVPLSKSAGCSKEAAHKCTKCAEIFCDSHLTRHHCEHATLSDEEAEMMDDDDDDKEKEKEVEEQRRAARAEELEREEKDRRERQCSHSDCTNNANMSTVCTGCDKAFCDDDNHLHDHSCPQNCAPPSGQPKLFFNNRSGK